MQILDLTSGNRAVWVDKNHRDAIYVDRRASVRPSVVADARRLPFKQIFNLVVFDPPHVNGGKNSNIARDYGHYTAEQIRDIVKGSAREAHRVALPDALMAFKWNDHDQSFRNMLALMVDWWTPLFGHVTSSRTKHNCQTAWVMLRRT